jgi:hypothetical protein
MDKITRKTSFEHQEILRSERTSSTQSSIHCDDCVLLACVSSAVFAK